MQYNDFKQLLNKILVNNFTQEQKELYGPSSLTNLPSQASTT
jgi:hypothetical protein